MSEDVNRHDAALLASRVTQWELYGLDQIWEMVRDENGRINWVQDGAWQRMAELCAEQADQLERALKQLTDQWPARPGTASFAFKLRIDELIRSMRDAVTVAIAGQESIRKITAALSVARTEVADLLDERQRYIGAEQQMIEYTRATSSFYRPVDGSAIPPPEPPRPPANWQDELDRRARQAMDKADIAVGAEVASIRVPTPYVVGIRFGDKEPLAGSPTGPSGPSSLGFVPGVPTPAFFPPTLADQRTAATERLGDPEPVLAGSPVPRSPKYSPVGLGARIDEELSPPGSFSPSGVLLTPGRSAVTGSPGGPKTPGTHNSPRSPQALGRATTSASGVGMPMAPMAPPIGGRGPGTSGITAAGRRATGGNRHRGTNRRDDLWVVEDGGPAVLMPTPDTSGHDPGPGVLGLDR